MDTQYKLTCCNSPVIGKSADLKTGVSRTQSMPNFLKNKHFLPPDMHTYMCISGGKKCSFFAKLGVLCFIETPILRFVLLPYYRQTVNLRLIYENVCRYRVINKLTQYIPNQQQLNCQSIRGKSILARKYKNLSVRYGITVQNNILTSL